MKPLIVLTCICLMVGGLAFSQEEEEINPKDAIVGKWKSSSNLTYEFTADGKVLKSDKEYATYRFLEGVLYLSYAESGAESETGLKFGDDNTTMELTEFKDREDSKTTYLRRIVE